MSYAPLPDPPGKYGRRVRHLRMCRTDEDFAILESVIRDNDIGDWGQTYESAARHIVCLADDSMGFGAEAWRNTMMNRLHASTYRGLTPKQVKRRQKKWGMD